MASFWGISLDFSSNASSETEMYVINPLTQLSNPASPDPFPKGYG